MGCGSSQVQPNAEGTQSQRPGNKPQQNGTVTPGKPPQGPKKTDTNANSADTITNNPVPRSVAFTVDLDGQKVDNKLIGAPPPRLKRLDPLNVPKLTAEDLAEKQRIADEKRDVAIKRKQSASLKASRRRRQILEAQQFEADQEKELKIDDQLSSAGKTREKKLKDIQEKQRIREDRAQRAREKVKKLNQLDQDLDLDVEKDEDYNANDVDSWLDGENNNNNNNNTANDICSDSGERIYSGRTSPKKRFHEEAGPLHRGISANTIDSFDNAYNRKPPSASKAKAGKGNANDDDFFDT